MTSQVRRDDRLRASLDEHAFAEPLGVVWPALLRLLSERGVQLVGHDRVVVGQPRASLLSHVTRGGFETARDGQRLVMESMQDASGLRYRAEGTELTSSSCRIVVTAIQKTGRSPSEERSRALDVELALVRALEPQAADAIDAAVAAER